MTAGTQNQKIFCSFGPPDRVSLRYRDLHMRRNRSQPNQLHPLASSPSKHVLFSSSDRSSEDTAHENLPQCVLFVHDVTGKLGTEFPNLWKFGQAYFKGDLVVLPDSGKSVVFKEMILGAIGYGLQLSEKVSNSRALFCFRRRYFSNLIRAAVIPQTLKQDEVNEYGYWGEENDKIAAQWLPSCLRHVRKAYASFIDLDLPGQALDIVKQLTTGTLMITEGYYTVTHFPSPQI